MLPLHISTDFINNFVLNSFEADDLHRTVGQAFSVIITCQNKQKK